MRSVTSRPQPTFFRNGPGEAGEGGKEVTVAQTLPRKEHPPFQIARNPDGMGLTFWSLAFNQRLTKRS